MIAKDRPAIICLGGGIEGLPIIQKVDLMGYAPIVIDLNMRSPGILWAQKNSHKAMAWQADVYNPRSVLSAVSRIYNHSRMKSTIAGVLCCATDTPDSQAVLAEKFRTPTIGREAARLAKDKWAQAFWLKEHNIPVPITHTTNIDGNMEVVLSKGCNIIKPVVGRGARGVSRFTRETYRERLIAALREAPEGYKWAVVQKWIDGVQLSTESVIQHGHILFTAVVERNYSRLDEFYPYVIEDGVDGPFHLSADHFRNMENLILRSALCMGWDNCTVKGDLIYSDGAFFVVEIAPRLSGGLFSTHMIPMCYEYDFLRSAVQLCVEGRVNNRDSEFPRPICQRYLFPKKEWIGKTIKFMPKPPDGEFTQYRGEGDRIEPVTSHSKRLAQVITTANLNRQARERAEEIINQVQEGMIIE